MATASLALALLRSAAEHDYQMSAFARFGCLRVRRGLEVDPQSDVFGFGDVEEHACGSDVLYGEPDRVEQRDLLIVRAADAFPSDELSEFRMDVVSADRVFCDGETNFA
jgi:hypothetical protein